METITRKGRVREKRPVLNDFKNLPNEHAINFIKIKEAIHEALGQKIDVYVYGSFFWGFWDDKSDYDVRVDFLFNNYKPDPRGPYFENAKKICKERYGFHFDILPIRDNKGVLIP
jgi:predicted nucleotidyltransferase